MINVIQEIDKEIARLQQARALLSSVPSAATGAKRGRPKGSKDKNAKAPAKAKKRTISAEGKARMAAAQKARWAAKKKAA